MRGISRDGRPAHPAARGLSLPGSSGFPCGPPAAPPTPARPVAFREPRQYGRSSLHLADRPLESPDSAVFDRPPLADWTDLHGGLPLPGNGLPSVAQLEALRCAVQRHDGIGRPRFAVQSAEMLADGLHYEERIRAGCIATRERNWHDLLNALVWLRYPRIKTALNLAQCADIAQIGRRERTRAQCAMTHFDEAGAIVLCSDPALVELWDRHDWHGLFWRERRAWGVRIAVQVFGHAVLELALQPARLLLAKSIVLMAPAEGVAAAAAGDDAWRRRIDQRVAGLIGSGVRLRDPQELRPLPLSGIPGWHPAAREEAFYGEAPCFRPLREGRVYPPADVF